jgi:hypothetical protein
MTRFLSTALIVLLVSFSATINALAQSNAPSRITTASGVRLRAEASTTAEEVTRLPLGVVVTELERSPDKAKVGEAEDYWYLVSAGSVKGWVFGGLVAPFDPARREETYKRLADERLANQSATFNELADLFKFLERATKEAKKRDTLAALELSRLVALGRSLAAIPVENLEKQPYKDWTTERADEIVYSEPAGQWYVRAELLWKLQEKYHDLATAEQMAWEAAQTPLPGECEGYLPCYLSLETQTNGKYLKLYPRGAHADAALTQIGEFFEQVAQDLNGSNPVYDVPKEDRADFQKLVAELRAQVASAASAKKTRLLKQLDDIAQRFR